MQENSNSAESVSMHWIRCPVCNRKTRTRVNPDTVMLNFPLYCPQCRQETIINVVQMKLVTAEEMKS